MKMLYVIGNPVSHSKSPLLFNNIFTILNIQAEYVPYYLESNHSINQFINNTQMIGFNITSPYKSTIMNYLDHIEICAINANNSNCVHRKNNQLYGYNTDLYGFEMLLENNNVNLSSDIIILGSGATASTVLCYLDSIKFEKSVYIISRNNKTFTTLFKKYSSIRLLKSFKSEIKKNYTVINCTPIKNILNDKNFNFIINDNRCNYIIDINYNFEKCDNPNNYINGNDMFIYQAIKSFDIWFGKDMSSQLNYKEINNILTIK